MSEPIRILIADDHPLFREGVAASLSREADCQVVGQASTGEEAFDLAGELLPDVLLMDISMPGEGGIAAAGRIAAAFPIIRMMMLTVSEDEDDLMNALRSGARGYVLKGISAHQLAGAIRLVADGGVYISPALAGSVLFEMTHPPADRDPFNELTSREKEILQLVAQGLTNREIGDQLSLAEKTIKHYMTNVLQKLHVRSRMQAVLLAQKHGFQ